MHRGQYGGTAEGIRPPLIGRAAELDKLRALYEAACGGTRVGALIWGEAGVGKSRLLEDFAVIAARAGADVGMAACFEYGGAPFVPLLEAFDALGVKVLRGLENTGSRSAAAVQAAKHTAFAETMRAMSDRAAETPAIIVVDDLQWADFATLEFLAFFARSKVQARLLILAAVRLDDLERDHARFDAIAKLQKDGLARIDLRPLPDAEMRRVIANVWPADSVPDVAQVDRICTLAEGKPYFAEELVGSAVAEKGPARPSPSIRAGVLSRFEQFSGTDRRVIRYASVIGRHFDVELLSRLCDLPAATVLDALAHARSLQIVSEVPQRRESFMFRHAVTREVIYGELLIEQARRIHREVAVQLARDSPGVDAAQLAYHLAASGEQTQAAAWYERAGDAAASRSAYADAAYAYLQAVAQGGTSGDIHAELCEKLSRALSINGDLDGSRLWCGRAVDGYVANGRFDLALPLALKVARRYYEAAEPQKAEELADWALRSLESAPNLDASRAQDIRYDAHVNKASFAALQGQVKDAIDEIARAEFIETRDPTLRHSFLLTRALVHASTSNLGHGFDDYVEAIALAREIGDDERLLWTLSNYGSRALIVGRIDAAIEALRESFDLAQRWNLVKSAALSVQNLALAYLLAGELPAAATAHAQGIAIGTGAAVAQTIATAVGLRLATLRADFREAAQRADEAALETAFRSNETQNIGLLAGCFAAHYDAIGRSADASQLRSRALAELRSVDFSLWLLDQIAANAEEEECAAARSLLEDAARDPDHLAARAHLALFEARIAFRDGPRSAAKKCALEAAALFDAIGFPWEQAQALEVAGRAAEALEIYRRLGYARDFERLSQARRRLRHRSSRSDLTDREEQIVRLAIAGKSNRDIAQSLFIGERTVETHIAAVFDRFDLHSRAELASFFAARLS